jgi:hypothetical protein
VSPVPEAYFFLAATVFASDFAAFAGAFATAFAGVFATAFAGAFTTVFAGDFTTAFAGDFTTAFAGALAGDFAVAFAAAGFAPLERFGELVAFAVLEVALVPVCMFFDINNPL